MNLWSDNRNHLLDDLLRDIVMAVIALAIGVPPGQFVLLVSVSRALQSLQHANVRIHFGRLGERLLVSPRFHRTHHAIGVGHESAGKGTLGGCNFGVLLPVWDLLFRTARFEQGIRRHRRARPAAAPERGRPQLRPRLLAAAVVRPEADGRIRPPGRLLMRAVLNAYGRALASQLSGTHAAAVDRAVPAVGGAVGRRCCTSACSR